jgi:regulator of protease activity HflC (stomatin/prohibitin superfamily)
MIQERPRMAVNGFVGLVVLLLALVACILGFIGGVAGKLVPVTLVSMAAGIGVCFLMKGLFMVAPNEGRVLQLFGSYVGTVREPGLRWANPFYSKERISLRVRNFQTDQIKVNDHSGNPIEIAAVVVWNVQDSAQALFEVDDFNHFVAVQSEAAIRNLASRYGYEPSAAGEISLRSHTDEIAEKLRAEIQERVSKAGVTVLEARISHLAYAPEIAHAMLRRQQAIAVIAARQKIVEGAVGMVEMALKSLSEHQVVQLDEKKKADMVANLLVVLCSDRDTTPTLSVGSASSHGMG